MAGRPKGSRGPDYESKRLELIETLTRACLADPHQKLSLRQMASACEVSVPTLNHYFGNRRGIVFAILEQAWINGSRYIKASSKPEGSLQTWIERELGQFLMSFSKFGLDRLNAWGISEGLADRETGPIYLKFFLEPTLQAAEEALKYFQSNGDIPESINLRFAALAMYSPCLVLFLHQHALGGDDVRPANVEEFIQSHARCFAGYLLSIEQ